MHADTDNEKELLWGIEAVHRGETYFNPDVARLALNKFFKARAATLPRASLSNRERQVLVLIADGLLNKEIAGQLGVGIRTVETHREPIMRKLRPNDRCGSLGN